MSASIKGSGRVLLAEADALGAKRVFIVSNRSLSGEGGLARKIAAALGVSAPWLAYGLGDTTADSAATCEGMGLRLQTVRVERDHTKASLARLAGLTAPSIAQIENGGQAGVDRAQ